MINQIRADFYRQGHTFSLLLLAVLTAVYAALVCGFQAPGGIMVNAPMSLLDKLAATDWSVYDGVRGAVISSSVLIYLFIVIFVVVAASEFSQSTYKNTLTSGISRLGFIFGKYVTMLADLFAFLIWYYAATLLTGVVAGRKLGTNGGHLFAFTGTALLVTGFFISVVFGLALVLLLLTRSQVLATIFIVVWPLAVSLVSILTNWHWLHYIDFFNTASGITFNTVSGGDAWRFIAVSAVILVASMFAASVAIRHQEL